MDTTTMSYDDITNDDGRILEDKDIALYRDKQGKLRAFRSICTHEECDLEWNSADKTWDCPCHGSRFTGDGHVITGPAVEPLEEVEVPK